MPKDTAVDVLEAASIAALSLEELGDFPKSADEPVFMVFVASWCEVSREAAPGIARGLRRFGEGARFAQVDVDVRALDTERLGVRSVPAVVLFARGREIARTEGSATEEEIAEFAEKALGDVPPAGAGESAEGVKDGEDAEGVEDAEGAEDVPAAPEGND